MAGATICAGTITTNPLSVGTTRCGIAIASRTRAQLSACPRSEEARTTASLGTSAVTEPYDSSLYRAQRDNAFSAAARSCSVSISRHSPSMYTGASASPEPARALSASVR